MDARAAAIAAGSAPELVWLLEHPPLYTAGTSANPGDVLEARFPVHETGRGGQLTYHGPGQRVAYVMLDLKRRAPDVRRFVASAGGMDHPHARRLQCRGRAARGPHRRVGAPAGQGRRLRGQDRRDRHPREALGDAARHRASTSSRSCRISPASCPAASTTRATASPASPISEFVRPMADVDAALRREFEPLFGPMAGQTVGSTEKVAALRAARSSSSPSR